MAHCLDMGIFVFHHVILWASYPMVVALIWIWPYAYCGAANEHPHVFRELTASPNCILK